MILLDNAYCQHLWLKVHFVRRMLLLVCQPIHVDTPPHPTHPEVRCDDVSAWANHSSGDFERTIQAENNAFLMCDNFERASWIDLLPPGDPESDAFDEELHAELP